MIKNLTDRLKHCAPVNTISFILNHQITSRRPISALWRYLRWQAISRVLAEVEIDWIENSKLIASNGMSGATGNIYCGLHEFVDMAFLLNLLRPEDLFIDIGANIGSYTVLASAVCGARTLAFEPDPITMRSLKRNITANNLAKRVKTIEAALGETTGHVRFTTGLDTINRIAEDSRLKSRMVEMLTLDGVLADDSPTLIKMDVEGYERHVVAGALRTLSRPSLLAVITETEDEHVRSALRAAGFQKVRYDPFGRRLSPSKEGNIDSKNSLFVRDIDECRNRISVSPRREIHGVEL
jgi:FkbM family methyltransferase